MTGRAAPGYFSGEVVEAHDAAHLFFSAHAALKFAVDDMAPVHACDAAHLRRPLAGGHDAGHAQTCDRSARLDIAEQSGGGAVRRQVQAGDRVPLPIKGAAESGDRGEVRPREVEVRRERDGAPLRPGVQRAVLAQREQVFHAPDHHSLHFGGCFAAVRLLG